MLGTERRSVGIQKELEQRKGDVWDEGKQDDGGSGRMGDREQERVRAR